MNKAIFLDRDGVVIKARVINGRPYPAASLDEVQITPGFDQVLQNLHDEGYLLIVVTNQPDVARGTQTRDVVESINQLLLERLPIEKVYTCFHDNADACDCRKPKPGLLFEAASEYDIDLPQSYMVGDRWSDIEAGNAAGCKTIYINYGYDERPAVEYNFLAVDQLMIAEIISGGMGEAY